jgi:hypothetical protein
LDIPDVGFKASLPSEPLFLQDSQFTDIGILPYRIWYAELPTEEGTAPYFAIHHWEYPAGTFPPDSLAWVAELLEETVRASSENTGGDLLYSSDIRFADRYPGKLWRIDLQDKGLVIRAQAFLAGHQFFLLQTIFAAHFPEQSSLRRFFDSFYLSEPLTE